MYAGMLTQYSSTSYAVYVSHSCIIHEDRVHRLIIGPHERAFSFKHRIRQIFRINPAASFMLTYYDAWCPGQLVTIANDEVLDDVMLARSVTSFRVEIDGNRLMKFNCPIVQSLKWYCVYVRHRDHFRFMDLAPGEPEFTFERLKRRIHSLFELPRFAHFLLKGTENPPAIQNESKPRATYEIANSEDLMEALERELVIDLCIIHENHSRVIGDPSGCVTVKIFHVEGGTIRLLSATPRMKDFSYEEFICSVRYLFQLSPSVQIELSLDSTDDTERLTITTGEELKNALPWLGVLGHRLLLNVDTSKGHIQDRHWQAPIVNNGSSSTQNSYVLRAWYNGTVRLLTLPRSELEYYSHEKFQTLILDLFMLPHSSQIRLIYEDATGDNITASTGQELRDAIFERPRHDPLEVEVKMTENHYDSGTGSALPQGPSLHVVKVRHNGTLRRLALCAGKQEISYIHSRIRNLFKLSVSAQISLSYVDKDQDIVSIVEDEDLNDAMTLQSLNPLMLDITVQEGLADVSMNPTITEKEELTDDLSEWETV